MSERDQENIWDPFGQVDGLSAEQKLETERKEAWGWYINGGGGDPRYFDYPTYLRNPERRR